MRCMIRVVKELLFGMTPASVLCGHETYGLPINITRCSNNYGPYQFPEKLIPLTISRVLKNKKVPIYGDGRNIRDWYMYKTIVQRFL